MEDAAINIAAAKLQSGARTAIRMIAIQSDATQTGEFFRLTQTSFLARIARNYQEAEDEHYSNLRRHRTVLEARGD